MHPMGQNVTSWLQVFKNCFENIFSHFGYSTSFIGPINGMHYNLVSAQTKYDSFQELCMNKIEMLAYDLDRWLRLWYATGVDLLP